MCFNFELVYTGRLSIIVWDPWVAVIYKLDCVCGCLLNVLNNAPHTLLLMVLLTLKM